MWNKFSYRFKITFIFTIALIVLTLSLTVLFTLNMRQNIAGPLTKILIARNFSTNPITVNENGIQEVDLPQEHWEELHSDGILTIEEDGIYFVGQLQEQLYISGQNFKQHSLWIAGMVILLGSLIAYFMAGVIVKPIKELSTSVEKIGADNLDCTLPIPKSHDEISQLTYSFNKMLKTLHRSFESKKLFAQNASHELKTPLAIIRSHLEVLEMNDQPTVDDYDEAFIEVKTSTERMIGLVEALLALGKTPDEHDIAVFKGTEIFESIIFDLKDAIDAKHLNVQILQDITIKGEKTLLRQAFFNVIHNAIRYNTEYGSIVIAMSENQITITDNGTGIPLASIGQIFEPFYCVDKSRSKHLGGNGLGLAITKNILDAHNMKIDVTSEVNIGTVISIYL